MTNSRRPFWRARTSRQGRVAYSRGAERRAGNRRAVSAALLSAVMLVPLAAACGSETAPDGTAAAPVTAAPVTSAPEEPTNVLADQLDVTIVDGPVPDVTGGENLAGPPGVAAGGAEPPTGRDLVVTDLVTGDGETATAGSAVLVQYLGTMWDDGSEFDSSWGRGGEPVSFPLDEGVITGFAVGIEGMKVGGRRLLVVPPDLGYGPAGGNGPISATDTLVFVIDLVDVEPGSTLR